MVLPTFTAGSLLYPMVAPITTSHYEWEAPEQLLAGLRIPAYVPKVQPAVAWLPIVSARIQNSVSPLGAGSTEWLNEGAANAAVDFFGDTADILPSEPHVYATHSGDLVAEFQDAGVAITAVISSSEAILFGAVRNIETKKRIIQLDAKLREETRSFMSSLGVQQDGKMAAS